MAQDGKKLKAPVIGAYRYGTMTGAEFAPSQKFDHPDVKLIGDWEDEGLGYWYAPWKAATALARAGLLCQQPGDGKKFSAVTGHRFCIYRQPAVGDSNAHDWFVVVYDAQGQEVTVGSFPDPVEPQEAAAPAAPPPQQQTGPPAPPAPATTANGEAKARRDRRLVAQVDATLGTSLAIAGYRHVQAFNKPLEDLDDAAVQDSAACVMIRLEHLGYDPLTDPSPAYVRRLRRLEHSIDPDRCPPVPEDVKAGAEKKPRRKSRAKPKEDEPEPVPEPTPVSTSAGAQSYDDFPEALDGEDDLPF